MPSITKHPVRKRTAKKTRGSQASAAREVPVPEAYLRLLQRFRLKPLQKQSEVEVAAQLADELALRDDLLPEEIDYLNLLCDVIERYEDENVLMADVSGAEMLRFLLDQRNISQQHLAKETGIASSTISAILQGNRELTRQHILKLAEYFTVEPAVFLPASNPNDSRKHG